MLERHTNQPSGSFSYGLGNRCCELSELLKPVLMLPSRRKGQERVKSQNPRRLGVKEWDIGRNEQHAKRRHCGEVQRWGRPSKLTWRTFSSWHKPSSKETPFHPVFDATSWLTQHPLLLLRVPSCITETQMSKTVFLRLSCIQAKGSLDFKISFGAGGRETQFNHSSLLFPLERRIEVHSRFLLWWWLCSLVVAELIEKYFNFHSIECV